MAKKSFYGSKPGQTYHYSNLGADTAALLVEEISGQDFNDSCIDNIFMPLGMTETGFRLANTSTPNLAVPYRCDHADGRYEPYPQFGYADYPAGLEVMVRVARHRGPT